MDLPQEKFDAIKQLSEIQTAIAAGRATLSSIKETFPEYLEAREVEAHQRVTKVLQESREALESTTQNQEELKAYGNELRTFSLEVKGFSDSLVSLFQDFKTRIAAADESFSTQREDIEAVKKQVMIQRKLINEDQVQIQRDRDSINAEWRLLNDRKALLEAGFKELKAKQK